MIIGILFSDHRDLAGGAQFDDARRLVGLVLLTACPAHIVDGLKDAGIDVAIVLGGRLSADVGRGRNDGLLETEAELMREGLVGDADADGTVVGNEIGCQVNGSVENQRGGLVLVHAVDKLPGHVGHIAHIALQTGVAVDETDEGLGVVALLDVIHALHGLGIGGVAANTPYGVGGIEYHPTLAHHFDGVLDILFLCHTDIYNYVLIVESDNADAGVRGMLLEILVEGHGFLDHAVVQLRGVEQMETVAAPHGKAQVGDVETGLVAGDGDDVAVAHHLAHHLGVLDQIFGNEMIAATGEGLLLGGNIGNKLGMGLQGGIRLGVATHIVDLDGLEAAEGGRLLLYLADEAHLGVVLDPVGEIVEARGIALDDALAIAQLAQVFAEGGIVALVVAGAEGQGHDILYQRGAVEFAGVDNQSFVARGIDLEGVGHIGDSQELTGKEKHVGRGATQGVDHEDAIGILGPREEYAEREETEDEESFHSESFLRYFFFMPKLTPT